MILPTYKEISDLVKKGLTLEAQEKIMELREGALELQEENLALKERLRLAEIELQQKKKTKHEHALYWMEGDPVPYCPRCYENTSKLIHLFGPSNYQNSVHYACHTCHHDFSSLASGAFMPELNINRRYASDRKF